MMINKMRINPNLIYVVTYKLLPPHMFTKQSKRLFLLRIQLGILQKFDKKAVTIASLEGQPCKMQQLITNKQRYRKCSNHTNDITQVQITNELRNELQIAVASDITNIVTIFTDSFLCSLFSLGVATTIKPSVI